MDPTTLPPPPSPEKSPPSPPQNPHTPTDAIIEASTFDCYHKAEPTASRSMKDFKAHMLKLAERLLPAHKSLIQQRFDDIIPDEFLVPDHPSYADMILTALWELKSEGGSSEEAISDFIEKEYHDLPWAHTTILNHHLKDLCMKGRITMKHDKCYLLCSSITNPVPSPSSTPPSSPDSSSSASICSSSSSSSSSLCWAHPYRTQKRKRKRKNIRGKRVRVRGRGRGRGMGTSRGRGRGRAPVIIKVGQRGSSCETNQATKQDRYHKEFKIGEESQMEDKNEVTDMEVDSAQDGITARINEENLPCEQHKVGDKEQRQPQKLYNVTWIGRGVRKVKEAERDILEKQSDDEVTDLEDDVSGDKIEKENQQFDTGKEQTLGEEQTMSATNDKILPFEAQVAVGSLGKQHDNSAEEEILPKIDNKEEIQTHEQPKVDPEQKILEKTEAEEQNDFLTGKQESKEQSEEHHDDVTDEPIHRNNDFLQSCGQDQLKNVEHSGEQHDVTDEPIQHNDDYLQYCGQDQLKNAEQSKEQHDNVMDEPIHRNYDSLQSCGQDQLKNVEQSEELHDNVTDEPIQRKDDYRQSCGQDQLKNVEQSEEQHDDVADEPIHRKDDSLQSCREDQRKNVEQSEEQHDNVTDEPIQRNDDYLQSCGQDQLKNVEQSEEQHDDVADEPIHRKDDSLQSCREDQRKNVEQSEEQHDNVTDEPIQRNDDYLQSCGQDQLKNVEQSEEQHDDVADEPIHRKDDSLQSCREDQRKNVEQSEEQHDNVTDEPIQRNDDYLQSYGQDQPKNVEQSEEQHDDVTDEPIHRKDDSLQSCRQDQLKNVEQSEEQHDDVADEPIHRNNDSLQSCGLDQLKNVEAESAEDQPQQEEHQKEVCQKETLLGAGTEGQQEEFVEMIEEQNQACIQQTEISEKEPLQEKNDALSDENSASSGSLDHKQQDEQMEPLRKRLRSSCTKVDATPKAKKQIEQVTPVRRSLRSHKTISEAPVITEVPDHSKEQLKDSGSSKRKIKIVEAEQVSNSNLRRSARFMIP